MFVLDKVILQHDDFSMFRRTGRLIAVLALQTGMLAWLVQLGERPFLHIDWSDLGTWLQVTPTENVLVAGIWLVAVICAGWVNASTLLYIAARLSRIPSFVRSVQWMTLPAIRKVGERALAALLATTTAIPTPVGAHPPPPVVVVVDDEGGFLPPGVTLPDVDRVPPLPTLPFELIEQPSPPLLPGEGVSPEPVRPDTTAHQRAGSVQITVQIGDNLWTISRRHLITHSGTRPTNEQIVPYWRKVIELNLPSLISGDPDLIYPGEVVTMPAPG